MMNYQKYETIGDITISKEYEGTPEEIFQLLKYEEMIKQFGWNEPKPLKDMKVTIDGSAVAEKVREALDEQYKKLQDLYK